MQDDNAGLVVERLQVLAEEALALAADAPRSRGLRLVRQREVHAAEATAELPYRAWLRSHVMP